jgi:hypothetical protein
MATHTENNASRVSISAAGRKLLDEMAAAEDVSPRQYLEALLHYAGSCHRRPGSWEANTQFNFANYDTRRENGGYADRWF